MLAPAAGSVPHTDLDPRVAEFGQEIPCSVGKLLDNLDAPDLIRKLRQNRRLVPQTSSYLEHLLVRMR